MFDTDLLKRGFVGLVGLRQNDNPNFPQIPAALTYTGSNLLVDHPLVNIENIDMCARNYGKYNYAAYNAATTYLGDTNQTLVRVTYNGKVYRSKRGTNMPAPDNLANLNNQPDISPLWWEELNLLGLYLEDLFHSANLDTVNEVFARKQLAKQTKTLLRNHRLYTGAGNINELIVGEGALVGLEIRLRQDQNILAVIDKIGLQLSQPQTLTFRLYHSSMMEPIASAQVTHTKTISFEWHTTPFKLHNFDPAHEHGGVFFLMYDQSDLVGQAVKKKHNFNTAPCASCNWGDDLRLFELYNRHLMIRAVKVPATKRNGVNLWQVTDTVYTPDVNYGLNLEVSVSCDITNMLLQNKSLFQFAVRDMIIYRLLQQMANSTRQNGAQEKVALMARNELQAQYAGGMGFTHQWERQMKAVDVQISDLDDTCMPCANKNGLSFGTFSLSR